MECSCKITSVALICLATHLRGSLRRSWCCSLCPCVCSCFALFLLYPCLLYPSFPTFCHLTVSLFPFLSVSLPFILSCLLNSVKEKHLRACLLRNLTYAIACSGLCCIWSFTVSPLQARQDSV